MLTFLATGSSDVLTKGTSTSSVATSFSTTTLFLFLLTIISEGLSECGNLLRPKFTKLQCDEGWFRWSEVHANTWSNFKTSSAEGYHSNGFSRTSIGDPSYYQFHFLIIPWAVTISPGSNGKNYKYIQNKLLKYFHAYFRWRCLS